jgi:primosomal protein N'
MPTFICRTCGFSEGEHRFCPNCEEPLVELTKELEAELQARLALHNAVGLMQNKKWY